jgi:hypothetical protein
MAGLRAAAEPSRRAWKCVPCLRLSLRNVSNLLLSASRPGGGVPDGEGGRSVFGMLGSVRECMRLRSELYGERSGPSWSAPAVASPSSLAYVNAGSSAGGREGPNSGPSSGPCDVVDGALGWKDDSDSCCVRLSLFCLWFKLALLGSSPLAGSVLRANSWHEPDEHLIAVLGTACSAHLRSSGLVCLIVFIATCVSYQTRHHNLFVKLCRNGDRKRATIACLHQLTGRVM